MACYNPNDLSPEELSCPICFEDFAINSSSERAPKLLMCLHTFCLGCIRTSLKSNRTIQCSICRTEHKDVSPLELFDNYIIIDYIKKQQEESDARLARQHSLADGRSYTQDPAFDAGFQERLDQVESDAEYARKIQSLYDEHPNIEPDRLESQAASIDHFPIPEWSCPAPCKVAVKAPTGTASISSSSVHVNTAVAVDTATTSQATIGFHFQGTLPPERQPSRSVTPDTSASSSTTPSSSTTSSNGTTTTMSSESTSSEDRCSSQASASSRLDDELVDSVEIIDTVIDRRASEPAGTAEANVSGSTGISALSAAHTNNSGFSSVDGRLEEVEDEDEDENDVSDEFFSELEEDNGEENGCVAEDSRDESDVISNMDVLEACDTSSNVIDESHEHVSASGAEAPPDDDTVGVEGCDWGSQQDEDEDELFDNFNILESSNADNIEEGNTSTNPISGGSSESEDSCADAPSVVDLADEESLESVLAAVNDPDDDTASTITLNDTADSESDNVVLRNEYNGVLTRSASSKLRKSNSNLQM